MLLHYFLACIVSYKRLVIIHIFVPSCAVVSFVYANFVYKRRFPLGKGNFCSDFRASVFVISRNNIMTKRPIWGWHILLPFNHLQSTVQKLLSPHFLFVSDKVNQVPFTSSWLKTEVFKSFYFKMLSPN